MLRVIREQEPPTPSSRISSSEAKASVAAVRQSEPAKLGRFVRGELDWIVMKALAKERDRRYETANGFANEGQGCRIALGIMQDLRVARFGAVMAGMDIRRAAGQQ